MTKILKALVSTKTTLFLLLLFATSMGVATFIENDFGTPTARAMVYEAWWFEIILVWMAINFLTHIKKYRLFSEGKWAVGLFHIAFVVIIIGAGVTRYLSNEGLMHIREGQAQNIYYSSEHYLQVQALNQDHPHINIFKSKVNPGKFKPQTNSLRIGEDKLEIEIAEYVSKGSEAFLAGNHTYVNLAITEGGGREDYSLKPGQRVAIGHHTLGIGEQATSEVQIFKKDDEWRIYSEVHLQQMEMASQKMSVLHAGEEQALRYRSLYQWDGGAFLVKNIEENAQIIYLPEENDELAKNKLDVVRLKVSDAKGKEIADVWTNIVSIEPGWHRFQFNQNEYAITYGPKAIRLPFSLFLRSFELERYPGSNSPASYASEVDVIAAEERFPYRIFMNNVLDYGGYRFYQASYDTDEKGTVLSLNQDRPGTYISYLGYFLLSLGMVLTLFAKGSRFQYLNKALAKMKKPVLTGVFILMAFGANAQKQKDIAHTLVSLHHAEKYGKLVVQDLDGRMKPLNTLANEIVRKLSGKSNITIVLDDGEVILSPEQFLLAVQIDPMVYGNLALIKIDERKSLRAFQALGIDPKPALSFRDFLSDDGEYLLHLLVEEANRLKPGERNEGHKELLKTDERFNIFYALLSGDFLRLFPNASDNNNTWFTSQQFNQGFSEEDGRFVKNIKGLYVSALRKGVLNNDWEEAEEILGYIALYQQKAGASVYPSQGDIRAELLYNKLNLGNRLFGLFWLLGILKLILAIWMLFTSNQKLEISWKTGLGLSFLGLLAFSFHLILRWYIAKHPPWSDGFEMLVFVAWGVLLFGLVFSQKSRFTVPLGLLFSGTLLFVSFLDWLNPEITNLTPVLHSYWLKIHVAVIVSGYAPLALAAVLALLSLVLTIFRPAKITENWKNSIQELAMVNEMSITVGLFLLTIGTFLGGVWANESWGRYWAWDPKETWALISVIVYAIVLHLRLVPAFRQGLVFQLASLWAFSSIVMTSFGVNYYLSGLHSYAKGDPVPVPIWVYWVLSVLFVISLLAWWRSKGKEVEA